MSQKVLTFPPPSYPGSDFVPDLSDMLKALASNRKGAARPSDVQVGETWINDSGTPWLLNLWDGVQDILIASINPTQHTLTMGGLDKLLGGAARGSATISGGIIAPQVAAVAVDTEGGGATDDLDSIGQSALGAGRFLLLSCVNASRKVVIKNQKAGAANPISTLDGADYTLDDPKKSVLLLAVGTGWVELSRMGTPFASIAEMIAGVVTGKPCDPAGVAAAIAANAQSGVEIGMTMPWGYSTLPEDWAWAAGQELSRTTYSDLFGTIGTGFGPGDGSTTFNVPRYLGQDQDLGLVFTNQLPSGTWTLISGEQYSNGDWRVNAQSGLSVAHANAAVDRNTSTAWAAGNGSWYSVGNVSTAFTLGSFSVISYHGGTQGITKVSLDTSDDGSTWTRVCTNVHVVGTTTAGAKCTTMLPGVYTAKYFRFTCITGGGDIDLEELELYATGNGTIIKVQ